MRNRLLASFLALASSCAALSLARAQDWPPPPDDPFATPQVTGAADPAAVWSQSLFGALPTLSVKGTLRVKDRAPAALLAVGEGVVHVVRPGDRLSIVKDGVEVPLEVVQVGDRAVLLRIGALDGATVTVR